VFDYALLADHIAAEEHAREIGFGALFHPCCVLGVAADAAAQVTLDHESLQLFE
jgi:hypothetical protein